MRSSLALVSLAFVAFGCSSSSTSAPPVTGDSGTVMPVRWKAAVGAGGLVAQTFDDVTWTTRTVAPTNLYSVACFGNYVGWTVGAQGKIAHTEDGGKTWAWQTSGTSAALRAVRFGSGTLGLAAGDAGTVVVTKNGGATWTPSHAGTTGALYGTAVAVDAGILYVAGAAGFVARSTDGGASWSRVALPGAGDIHGIAANPGAHLVVAVDRGGAVWSSADAGVSFHREWTAPAALAGVDVSDDGTTALAVGAKGTMGERAQGGAWRIVPSGTTADLHAALVTGDSNERHYAGGENGTLVTSADHGGTWKSVALPTTAAIWGLEDL